MKKLHYFLLLNLAFSISVISQVVKIETLSTGLLYPVCIQNTGMPGDNRLFVLEKRGRIKIVNRLTGVVNPVPFLDIYSRVFPITSVGDERGLLGLAFHPDYANNGYFYVNYVNTLGKTVIARYQVSPFADTAFKYSEQILLTIFQPYSNHKGGNLMFGPEDGYLYISQGDGGSSGDPGNRAQNKDSLLGKMLRINVNNPSPPYYSSAPENPFYGAIAGRDEIFDWGLRNAWRCSFDRLKHDLWIADVGQNNYEEIDFRSKCDTVGHNYGWRCYEGNTAYNTTGCQPQSNYTSPVFVYTHSLGCSVTGGYVYRGAQEGSLFGKYLFTDYCQGRIWATEPNGSGGWNTNQLTQQTAQINNNFSTFGEDVEGELYLAAVSSGLIYRLKDTACAPSAYIHLPDTLYLCNTNPLTIKTIQGNGLSYNWNIVSTGSWSIGSGQGTATMTALPELNSTAIIKVTVSNGTCSAISNSIVVIPFANFSLNPISVCYGGPSSTLTGFPAGGTFSGAGISGNVFNPNTAGIGTHTLSYSFADNTTNCYLPSSGCILSQTKSVSVYLCVGLEELEVYSKFKIFPNPCNSEFNVEFDSPKTAFTNLKVCDALGGIVFEENILKQAGLQSIRLKLNNVEEGVYFVYLKGEHLNAVKKIIILK